MLMKNCAKQLYLRRVHIAAPSQDLLSCWAQLTVRQHAPPRRQALLRRVTDAVPVAGGSGGGGGGAGFAAREGRLRKAALRGAKGRRAPQSPWFGVGDRLATFRKFARASFWRVQPFGFDAGFKAGGPATNRPRDEKAPQLVDQPSSAALSRSTPL